MRKKYSSDNKMQKLFEGFRKSVLEEQEQERLDEGSGMMAALAFLFAGGAENITIDGKSFTQETLAQSLDQDGDDQLDKKFPQSMLDVAKQDAEFGFFDLDGSYSSSDFRTGSQHMKALASGAPDASASPAAKTIEKMADNPNFVKRVMDKIQKSDNPAEQAKQLQDAPGFDSLDQIIQDKINSIASSSN